MPGGETVALLDALQAAGIRFVLARQETSAAIMAAGAFAATGAPGLLVTTLGPGLANAVNGIADAAQERVPLIVISAVVDRQLRGRYTHQVIDHAALLRPLVKASFEIEAEGAPEIVARAVALACAEPKGPVHLDLSAGVAAGLCRAAGMPRPASSIEPQPAPDDSALGAARRILGQAQQPLVIAGHEAVRAGAGAAIEALMQRIGAPLVTTYKAKGIVDETRPLCLGGAGLSPLADGVLLDLVGAADAVLLAGYDPIEMRQGWLDPFAPDATVVELGSYVPDHGMHRASVRIAGAVGSTLDALVAGLPESSTWRGGEPAKARARLTELFAPRVAWGPHAVFDVLQAKLPGGAVVTVDSGAHRILLSQQMRFERPGALLQSAGFCTMGAAIPLAAGYAAARPGTPVVAVLGDGGLEMCLGELGTLRDARLPVVVVVLQDESLALIELKQAQAGLERQGVTLGKTRYEDIARAFGGTGLRVFDRAGLEAALASGLTAGRFTLIACEIEAGDYAGAI
jgi:acetolactate synthase-1/2/3 large subunit